MKEEKYEVNMNALTLEDCVIANEFGVRFVLENGRVTEIIEKIAEEK